MVDDLARSEPAGPIPQPTPALGHSRLCIGMSTFADFDGVYFTIQSLRMTHPEVLEKTSFLILDNHPEGPEAEVLHDFAAKVPNCRYLPFAGYTSTAVRDLIFREADADIVLCVDSHVLIAPGGLRAVIDYFDHNPESDDIVQGPLLDDALENLVGTHFAPGWGEGMWGQWAVDEQFERGVPFEIPMQGLGVFACRRASWPGINPRFRGFGGEEGYLHEKFRQRGGRAICLPPLAWAHRFGRPRGFQYAASWESRIRNYYFGWREVGWDTSPIDAHYRELLGLTAWEQATRSVRREVESPFSFFDAILCTGDDRAAMRDRCRLLDIAWRVERVASQHAGLAIAAHRDYDNVLILDDGVSFIEDTVAIVGDVVDRLRAEEWDLLRLGASHHAVGFNRPAIERLAALECANDKGFRRLVDAAVYSGDYRVIMTVPRVATHPSVALDDAVLAERYVI